MQLAVTQSNTLRSLTWIKNGWRLFTLKPSVFMAMTGIVLFFSLLANIQPLLGLFIGLFMPFLTAGYYLVCSKVEQGEEVTPGQIFSLFSEFAKYRVLMRIGLVAIVIAIPFGSAVGDLQVAMNEGGTPEPSQLVFIAFILIFNLMLVSFAIPAAWVAPETPVIRLLQQSFYACWSNIIPLVVYVALMFLISMLSFPLIIVGWVIAIALWNTTFYQAFLDIYRPVEESPEQQEADSEAAERPAPESAEQETEQAAAQQNDGNEQNDARQDVAGTEVPQDTEGAAEAQQTEEAENQEQNSDVQKESDAGTDNSSR